MYTWIIITLALPSFKSYVHDLGFGACGTVRVNRRGLPPDMKATLAKGDTTLVQVDESMMALKWMDKRPVCMLSTIHDDYMTTKVRRTRRVEEGQEEIRKPVVVEEYNTYMGGVDKSDQLLSYYGFSHRTVKWWKQAAFHTLDVAVVNVYIVHKTSAQSKKFTH